MSAVTDTVKRRPAESAASLGALATGVAALAGGSVELVAVTGIAAGLVPAAVSQLVDNGGISGICRLVLRGRQH